MVNNDMFLGSTYTKGFIDIESEHIPQPFFRVRPGENHVFESCSEVSFDTVLLALADGTLTELDVAIVKLTAVFASGFLLTNTVKERLTLMGYVFTDSVFNSAIRRLKRLELITVAHIKKDSGGILMTKLISLSFLGSKLAVRLGVPHSYNEVSQRCSTTGQVKAYAQGAQLLTNIQKKYPVEEFFYRPVILCNAHAGEIVRPTFSIIKGGKTIYFDVVRRTDYWQTDIAEKLERFNAVVFENDMIVINCENEEMSREASDFLADKSYKFGLYFTDDLASFGKGINSFIYRFEKDGTKNSVGL